MFRVDKGAALLLLWLLPSLEAATIPPYNDWGPVEWSGTPDPLHCAKGHEGCTGDDICELDMSADKANISDVWEMSGAQSWFKKWLKDKNGGVENWADNLLTSSIGQGYDCVTFPDGACSAPDDCSKYKPKEAAYIHNSITTLYHQFSAIRTYFQDQGIELLASGIKEIVEDFGPPPEEGDDILSLLLDAFGMVAGMMGPLGKVGEVMGVMADVAGVASEIATSQDEPLGALDYEHDLEMKLGKFYNQWSKALDDAVTAFFKGDLSKFDLGGVDEIDYIARAFAGGVMLNPEVVRPRIDQWFDQFQIFVKKGFVIQALKLGKYYVWQDWKSDEEKCNKAPDKQIWMYNRCTSIVKDHPTSIAGYYPSGFTDEQMTTFRDKYRFNLKTVLQNAVECSYLPEDERHPEFVLMPDFKAGSLPKCFANFLVSDKSYDGLPPPEDMVPPQKNDDMTKGPNRRSRG